MDREKLDGWCEKGILALMLAILVFGPLAIGGVRTWQWLIIEGLTLGIMALWGLRWWVGPKPQLLWPPVCWAVLAFLIYGLVRYAQADIEYVARREVVRVLVYAILFLAVVNNLHRQEMTQAVTLTLVFLGMGIAMFACWQMATKSDIVWNLHNNYPGRASGTFIYPNSLAVFLEMLTPLALCYALLGRLGHVTKILMGYAALVMLAGVAVTLSRGGLVVTSILLVVLCVVLLTQRGCRLQGLALAVVLVIAGALVVPKTEVVLRRFQNVANGTGAGVAATDDMRLTIWEAGWRIWQDNFWFGAGPAHFDYRFRQYRPAKMQLDPDRVHNEYLNTLADWGVAGAALVTAAWTLLGWGLAKSWRFVCGAPNDFGRKQSNKFALAVGGAVGLLGILLHSAVDFNLDIPAIAILMVTLMALLSSQIRFATERFWLNLRGGLKIAATVVLLAAFAGLAYAGWRGAREDRWLRQAAKLPDFSKAQVTALEKAFAVEPMNPETAYRIGEGYRTRSFLNQDSDPDALAKQAMDWYRRGMKLDPYDGYNWLRSGMCLDWINAGDDASKAEAEADYQRADALDPNGSYMAANIGWHYVQIGDDAAARSWFERSLRLQWISNAIPEYYVTNVQAQLEAAAAGNKPGANGTNRPALPRL